MKGKTGKSDEGRGWSRMGKFENNGFEAINGRESDIPQRN